MDLAGSVSGVEIQEVSMGPGMKAPLHFHPCPAMRLIAEGSVSLQIEGQPVRHLCAGNAFCEPGNVRVAKLDNDNDAPARFAVFCYPGENENETPRILAE